MKLIKKFLLVLLVAGFAGSASCTKDKLRHEVPSPDQLISGRLNGTWTTPGNVVTPDNVPADVFGKMRLVFTTDSEGRPSKFLAQECPIIFGNDGAADWTVTGTEDNATVNLTGAGPVDEFTVRVSSGTLTISFFMGWENTDTKETGKGDFQVTLIRQ